MARGRPTKFKRSYPEKMLKFFDVEPFYEVTVEINGKGGHTRYEPKQVANTLPTMSYFAANIGVHEDTLVEWAKEKNKKKYPGFNFAYNRAKDHQVHMLVINGLQSLYPARFAIFVLKNILGHRKIEVL